MATLALIMLIIGLVCIILIMLNLIKNNKVFLSVIMTVMVVLIFISTDFLSRGLPTSLDRLKVGEKYVVVVAYEKYIITRSIKNNNLLFIGLNASNSNFVVGSSYIYTSNNKLKKLE